MIRNIFIYLSLFFSIQGFSQLNEKEIFVIDENNDTLRGTLCIPQEKIDKDQSLILIIAGSGPTDRNGNNSVMINNSLQMMAHDLARSGVASIRYDKRGVGASKNAYIPEEEMTFEQNVKDAQLFYNYGQSLGTSKILVTGHSEGSLIGILLSNQNTPSAFISLAGAGRPIQEVLKEQYNATAPIVRDSAHVIIDLLSKGQKVDTLSPWLFSVFRPSIQPYIISWMQYDPANELNKLTCPTLVIQGTTDIQVSVADAERLAEKLPADQLIIIDDMNHIFKKVESDRTKNKATYNNPSLPLHPDLIYSMITFLKGLE